MKPCKICGRWFEYLEEHHVVFRSSGGTKGPKIEVCLYCHKGIHAGRLKIRESLLTKEQIDYVIHKKWPGWFRIDWGK